ncbi:DNA (cytosine-5-)-methyltransferase [Flavobacterium endoglycinae]|uniref:Cytosine-specific methyltransferase n=1 Tax=Flavobacterium endoglycinae TaxID=2816357 RepID=A0ABX7Q9H2_9FLAO|nr:DNA (cytosine-5-)-methyltransferase [Flavobacterium endoglycinae]QSW87188.1 DNA (cytosine-5-)-methyltransferase [Flavobacterium endoglycinae]
MENKYTVGSLYAGVGGICLGFEKSGFTLKWANEFDKKACITYRNNFKHNLIEGDVMELDVTSLEKVDILTAGFPCQPFSLAGHRKGFNDSRGNHFFKILDFIDEMRPKVVFLENVKNLRGHDKGNTLKVIQSEIKKRNYTFDSSVLNTKDFGNTPHNRERLFMIAFDKEFVNNKKFKFQFPEKEHLTKSLQDLIITDKVPDKFYYTEDKYMYNMLKESVVNKNHIYQFRRQYVRENKSGLCPTLTANMGTGGHNVPIIITDHGFRKLTPRECFRLQGFPDEYKLPAISNSSLYKQAGNSVSMPVIQRLAAEIFKVIEKVEAKKLKTEKA